MHVMMQRSNPWHQLGSKTDKVRDISFVYSIRKIPGGNMRDIYCNVFGKKLFIENGILKEDAFEAKKQWGYFSNKDGILHSFVICEKCYDKMIDSFVIPPEITEVHEL